MTNLPEHLQSALGSAYRVERELGGGGMSRVFLAEEIALGRNVVVKVLPPEMAAGVNAERFRREIQFAASLQHPHIVSLLTAGSVDDLLYYVMPHIAGESLRQKLTREAELPVSETVHILRDVLDALAEAHAKGLVHRDIKPDNVLLSGKHAMVTDFGVAKAVSEAASGTSLTSLGVALGTPAYMAPEQAAADPHIDHRADIYAVGALAYEMLCGRPPFVAATPQAVLGAHVTQTPEPCTTFRPSVPPALSLLVSRCLEKKPADRPQSVEEVLATLDAMATLGSATAADAVVLSSGTRKAIERLHPVRVFVLSAVSALTMLAVVYALVRLIGLPAWVTPVTGALVAVGIPLLIVTGYSERWRLIENTTDRVQSRLPGPLHSLTWKRAYLTGGIALGSLAVLAGAYVAMRVLGIGPVGTLIAKGALSARDAIVISAFENRTSDSTSSHVIEELLRTDLQQSPAVRLLAKEQVADALTRMQHEPRAILTASLAREVAQREGAKAVLTGEIALLGSSYVVSLRLLSVETMDVLVARRETASGSDDLIGAVDRLSKGLRERIGESLRSVQAAPPLAQVTTSSLGALKKYTQGILALDASDWERAVGLFREAIRLDTTFAMAYRILGSRLYSSGAPHHEVVDALTKAFDLRSRLPEQERMHVEAAYYSWVLEDRDRGREAYRGLLDGYPNDGIALVNLGVHYVAQRRYAEAETAYARAARLPGARSTAHWNLVLAFLAEGKPEEADTSLRHWADRSPGNPALPYLRARLALLRGDYDGADAIINQADPVRLADPGIQALLVGLREQLAMLRGQLRDAQRLAVLGRKIEAGGSPEALADALYATRVALWYPQAPNAAAARALADIVQFPMDSLLPAERNYRELVLVLARSGHAVRASELLERYEREVTDISPRERAQELRFMRGQVALAAHQWPEAIAELRAWEQEGDPLNLVWLADAFDQASLADSAMATYERWLTIPGHSSNGWWLPRTLRRLGELHESRGNQKEASAYYRRFADLWADADSELQPMVREARSKAGRLGGS